MGLYWKIDRATNTVLKRAVKDNPKRRLDATEVWLPVEDDPAIPTFDDETHRIDRVPDFPDLSDLAQPVPANAKITIRNQAVAMSPGQVRSKIIRKLTDIDLGTVRAIEDIHDLLIAKGVFAENELPPPTRAKMAERRRLRGKL
jgi:hypothetical protein